MCRYIEILKDVVSSVTVHLHKESDKIRIKSGVYNRLPVLQISIFRPSSQYLVASGRRRPTKPSVSLCITQSTTTCCRLCNVSQQAHVADSWSPHSFNVSATRVVLHRRRFSFTNFLRGRSVPGGSTGLG